MNDRRLARIRAQIKERAAEVVTQELADPKLGFVTITRIEVDRDLDFCTIFWSVIGGDHARTTNAKLLERATPLVRREVGNVLRTRKVPKLKFAYDESIEGALRMETKLRELRDEREAREATQQGDEGLGESAPPDDAVPPKTE